MIKDQEKGKSGNVVMQDMSKLFSFEFPGGQSEQ